MLRMNRPGVRLVVGIQWYNHNCHYHHDEIHEQMDSTAKSTQFLRSTNTNVNGMKCDDKRNWQRTLNTLHLINILCGFESFVIEDVFTRVDFLLLFCIMSLWWRARHMTTRIRLWFHFYISYRTFESQILSESNTTAVEGLWFLFFSSSVFPLFVSTDTIEIITTSFTINYLIQSWESFAWFVSDILGSF